MFAHTSSGISIWSRSLALVAPIVILLAALSAQAAPIGLFVATDYGIDQKTGMKGPIPLNPSGTADLVFFERGVEIHFEDAAKAKRYVRIHLDFDALLEAPEQARLITTQIYDNIQLNGPRVMASLLQQISTNAIAQKTVLAVMLDSRKNPGFLKVDFDLGAVRLVTSAGENVRFQNLVAQQFMPTVPNSPEKAAAAPQDTVAEKDASRAATEEAPQKPLNGEGPTFVKDFEVSTPRPHIACELRFMPTW